MSDTATKISRKTNSKAFLDRDRALLIKVITNLENQYLEEENEVKKFSYKAARDIKTDELNVLEAEISALEKEIWSLHDQLKAETEAPKKVSKKQAYKRYNIFELESMPKKKWLVDKVFGRGDLGEIYGASGCGKTFVVIDMIMSMCKGETWAKQFDCARPLSVAYCAGEGLDGLPERFKTARKFHGSPTLENFHYFKVLPQLFKDCNKNSLTIMDFILGYKAEQESGQVGPLDLLVIDTLRRASDGADENSSQDMTDVANACQLAIDELGCSVVLIHHTNKSATAERGSGALRGAADFMIEIKKSLDKTNDLIMHCDKLKDDEEWKDTRFKLTKLEGYDSVHITWADPDDDNIFIKPEAGDKKKILNALDRFEKGLTCAEISKIIDKSSQQTNKLLNKLVQDNLCHFTKDPEKGSGRNNPMIYLKSKSG